jgi:hypothetical protein
MCVYLSTSISAATFSPHLRPDERVTCTGGPLAGIAHFCPKCGTQLSDDSEARGSALESEISELK